MLVSSMMAAISGVNGCGLRMIVNRPNRTIQPDTSLNRPAG